MCLQYIGAGIQLAGSSLQWVGNTYPQLPRPNNLSFCREVYILLVLDPENAVSEDMKANNIGAIKLPVYCSEGGRCGKMCKKINVYGSSQKNGSSVIM